MNQIHLMFRDKYKEEIGGEYIVLQLYLDNITDIIEEPYPNHEERMAWSTYINRWLPGEQGME